MFINKLLLHLLHGYTINRKNNMKTLMIIGVLFTIVMTIALLMCKSSGLHPNMFAWVVIIPCLFAFLWAKGTLLNR